nr:hypothetical protein [Tanacetum cinerariifolium]
MLDQTFDRLQNLVSQLELLEENLSQEDVNQKLLRNNNTSSTNGAVNTTQAVNTAYGVSTASTQVSTAYSTNINNLSGTVICSLFDSQPNSPQLIHEDLEQIHPNNMKEMDLRWQMAMLTIRAKSHDLVFEALEKRQIGEDAIISPRDMVYRLFPRDPVSRSTPSGLRIKQKFVDEIGELRAISGHVLRAARVQIPENYLDNLHSSVEEDGTLETV